MYERWPRSEAETEYRRRERVLEDERGRNQPRRRSGRGAAGFEQAPIMRRPDRIALWAVGIAVVGMVAAAASAHAASGGTGSGSTCSNTTFGARSLRLGDCGSDVTTLHWIMKAASYRVSLDKRFDDSTKGQVEAFQKSNDLAQSGVVRNQTRKRLVRTMPKSTATWYGPGFWNQKTACGVTLKRHTLGVAHRNLPCGTKVTLKYGNRFVTTTVIDRGPYAKGVRWDLTRRTARELHLTTTDDIRAAAIKK
jgi:hypothetical protein